LGHFQTLYKPIQQVLLDDAMILYKGCHRLRTHNREKLGKYGIFVFMA